MAVQILKLGALHSDTDMERREGDYWDLGEFRLRVCEDTDAYKADGSLLFRFRKAAVPEDSCRTLVCNLRDAAMSKHNNRGAAAGPLSRRKMATYCWDWHNSSKFRTGYITKKTGVLSKTGVSNLSPSNIIGYYDRRDRNDAAGKKCRLTAFSKKQVSKWEGVIPELRRISELFRELVPDRFSVQMQRAQLSPDYTIAGTCFSTATVNYSWRTASHKDVGDLHEGFGTLLVCEDEGNPNKYSGCCTGFPQYGVCVDVRNGDFLAMDVHEWHCNTEFVSSQSPRHKFRCLRDGDFENGWYFNRLAIVCYLRHKMHRCGAEEEATKDPASHDILKSNQR